MAATVGSPSARHFLCVKRSAVMWVESVLGENIKQDEDFFLQLVDGVILCKVMQRISPALIPRIRYPAGPKRRSNAVFKTNENVSFFLQACVEIGVPRHKRFVLHDLVHAARDHIPFASAKRILECLESLCEIANADKKYEFDLKWPVLHPDRERFSQDELLMAEQLVVSHSIHESHKEQALKKIAIVSSRRESNAKPSDSKIKIETTRSVPASSTTGDPSKQPLHTTGTGTGTNTNTNTNTGAGTNTLGYSSERVHRAASRLQALVRGWLARTRFRAMVRNQAYRDKVAQEILQTERVYVDHLEFLHSEVLLPLRSSLDQGSPILQEPEIRSIFSEVDVLLNYNRLFLAQLEPRVSKWNVHQRLGDIFLQIVGFLKIYSQYCSNYNEAMRVLGEAKKQGKFKKFLDDLKKKNNEIQQRGIEDFLIRPVQRIPRYYLLLQDLVRHTSMDHPDYANLQLAAQKVQSIAEYMNEKKREFENIQKVTEIQEMIDGDCEPLAKPHRRYVKEGQLHTMTKGTTRKQAVVCFLFNDLLVITKSQGSSFLSRSKIPRLQFINSYRLYGANVSTLEDTAGFNNGFEVLRKASKRSITLLCPSRECRDEWVRSIEEEIQGATDSEEKQDLRTTNRVKDKVEDAKAQLEKKMSNFLETHQRLSTSKEALATPLPPSPASPSPHSPSHFDSPSPSLSSSSEGSPVPTENTPVRKMSLREKRLQLMEQARKSNDKAMTFGASSS